VKINVVEPSRNALSVMQGMNAARLRIVILRPGIKGLPCERKGVANALQGPGLVPNRRLMDRPGS